MPPKRTPLRDISSNRVRGKDLIPYMRSKIVGMANNGPRRLTFQYNMESEVVKRSAQKLHGVYCLMVYMCI